MHDQNTPMQTHQIKEQHNVEHEQQNTEQKQTSYEMKFPKNAALMQPVTAIAKHGGWQQMLRMSTRPDAQCCTHQH